MVVVFFVVLYCGKDVISWWPLPRPFFVSWVFQHVVFHFFGGMVSAALWFFDSLVFCSGALIRYISSICVFSFLSFY